MENKDKKLVVLFVLLVCASIITAWHSLSRKSDIKGKIKELYSVVITEQSKDGMPIDSVKNSIERFRDIDSSGYTHDAKVIDFIIQDYQRLSEENRKLKQK